MNKLLAIFIITPGLIVASPHYQVNFVIDGDTIIISNGEKIRLWGVDAPELGTKAGEQAKLALHEKVIGQAVLVEGLYRDQYDRLVAKVFISDTGQELNAWLIEQGWAKEYCFFSYGYYGNC